MSIFKKTKIAVSALILNSSSQFLIVKRAKDDSMPGLWELPGGKIEFGEDPKIAMQREVKEETGLDILLIKPLSIRSSLKDNEHVVRIAFFAVLSYPEQIVLLSKDHSEYKWTEKPWELDKTSDLMLEALGQLFDSSVPKSK